MSIVVFEEARSLVLGYEIQVFNHSLVILFLRLSRFLFFDNFRPDFCLGRLINQAKATHLDIEVLDQFDRVEIALRGQFDELVINQLVERLADTPTVGIIDHDSLGQQPLQAAGPGRTFGSTTLCRRALSCLELTVLGRLALAHFVRLVGIGRWSSLAASRRGRAAIIVATPACRAAHATSPRRGSADPGCPCASIRACRSLKVSPVPSSTASLPVMAIQRSMATST